MRERQGKKEEGFGGRALKKRRSEKFEVTGEEARKLRFPKELKACNILIDCMNEVIDKYRGKIKTRGNLAEKDLDLLVSTMYGKGAKTFQAIIKLCCLGFGEDSLILLRANVNLVINLYYILSDNSVARAGDFIAYSHREQKRYLQEAHEVEPDWMKKLKWDEIDERAIRWGKVNIAERAKKAQQYYHYKTGYRFYSSFEHSDAQALSRYVVESNETGRKIGIVPSDEYVSIALIHNFWIMANIFLRFCSHHSIEEKDIETRLDENWKKLAE